MVAAHPALADVPLSQDPRSPWAEHLGRDVRVPFALYELARGDVWRRRFLHGAPALTAAERERATGHLTAAFEVLFVPWFAGTATLNRDALLQWWDEVTRERVQPAVPPTAPATPTSGRKGSSSRRIR